jgi:hypothetical protein
MGWQQSGLVIVLRTVLYVSLKACGSSKRIDQSHCTHADWEYWRCCNRSSQQHRPVSGQQIADVLAGYLCKHAQTFTGARATTAAHPARIHLPTAGGRSDFLCCADVSCRLSGSTSSSSATPSSSCCILRKRPVLPDAPELAKRARSSWRMSMATGQ